jgi:cytochrome c peroxidase
MTRGVSLHRSVLALLALGCSGAPRAPAEAEVVLTAPPGFPRLQAPEDNQPTAARIALGRRLFYDERLSRTGDVSCASCHVQANAFADPNALSTGVQGRQGTRNAVGLINAAWGKSFFWDGRAATLELQASQPIQNPVEMDTTLESVSASLADDPGLTDAFDRAYAAPASEVTITRALASFVRSLLSANSRYDAFLAGDADALSPAERRGEAIFNGERGECFHCHVGYNLTSQGFRNNGIAADDPDPGRAELTQKATDLGKFKTPTLRNVAVTAPYMQDGSLPTLAEVIEQYDAGGRGHANTDPLIRPLDLRDEEKADLLAFLGSLTDDVFLTNPAYADPDLE